MSYTIVGIHTGIGKTVCSAVLCQALGYDYWKPVQAGDLDNTDSLFIQKHVCNPLCHIHTERHRLLTPASPHYAAALENIELKREDFSLPKTENKLIVETAGGLLSPLASNFCNIDLVKMLALPVVLVSNNYLGSINHTLMTAILLKKAEIDVHGIVFVGDETPATESYILEYTGFKRLFSIPFFTQLNAEVIAEFTANLQFEN